MGEYVEKFRNQYELLDPEKAKTLSLGVVGVGAIGSFYTMTAAKMGFMDITVWDPDTVEPHNFANQIFPRSALGKNKAMALKEVVKEYTGVEIKVRPFRWSPDVHVDTDIHVICVDNMSTRKAYWEHLMKAHSGSLLIDGRMGAQVYRTFAIDLWKQEHREYYNKTLHSDEAGVQERCGQKSIIYTVLGVASDMLNATRRAVMELDTPIETVRDYDGNIFVPTWKREIVTEAL